MNQHFHKKSNSGKADSKGFYVALGVCLIAIGVAAWTTYDSVINYAGSKEEIQSSEAARPANDTMSGVFVSPRAEESRPQALPEPSPAPEEASAPEASSQPVQSRSSEPAPPPADEAKQTAAKPLSFSYPAGSSVTKKFSGENPEYSKTMKDWRAHAGTDFAARQGDEVKAAADGVVQDVYYDELFGNIIYVEHGDVGACYCGVRDMAVKKGDTVTAGQKLALVGEIPCESEDAPHFHFAMKQDGKWIDPASILK